ncbi:MAG: prepilin-type N-terminal cleavage/methylation domain-containing protein [Candidatus Competibacteraceae bacterium]|nr:prepilin-type N-terminal cleavage/methylation domain-containing protein [Candidatus Competibacteraceae bacterium]
MKKIYQYQHGEYIAPQQGFTLVEILAALVISLFLIAGVIQLFVGTKQTYRGHDGLSRIQENGRFALDAMTRDIRMTGYQPHRSSAIPCPSTLPNPPIQATSNSIQIQWCDPVTAPSTPYQCTPTNGICNRSYLVICNSGGSPPCTGGGDNDFGDLILNSETSGGNQKLIEGVADMRITPTGNPVTSVTIDLLLVSSDQFLATQPQTVTFPPGSATSYTAPDRRLVQIFSTTVAIRNR